MVKEVDNESIKCQTLNVHLTINKLILLHGADKNVN